MAYRPVPETPHTCVHCNTLYYAKDKRRIYCTSSCNTLAWMARKATKKIPKLLVKVQPSLSSQDIAAMVLTQVGALFANYKLNDQPAQKQILAKLASMEQGLESALNQLLNAGQDKIDFINAMKGEVPGLQFRINQEQHKRQLEAANHQRKKDRAAAIIAKRFG